MMMRVYDAGARTIPVVGISNLARNVPHAGCQLTLKKLFTTLDKGGFLCYIITMNARIRDGPLLGVVKRELTPPVTP